MIEQLLSLDGNILLFIQNNIRNPILTPPLTLITHLGDAGIFWILLTLALLIPKKTRRAALCSMIALVGTLLINNIILKNLVARTRPYEVIDGLRILVGRPDDFSFPSGHSGASFASAVALAKNLKRPAGILLILLAVVIALSRLYVGVHYPTDVICGSLIGILCGLFGSYAGNKTADSGKLPFIA